MDKLFLVKAVDDEETRAFLIKFILRQPVKYLVYLTRKYLDRENIYRLADRMLKREYFFFIIKEDRIAGIISCRFIKKYWFPKYNRKYWLSILIDVTEKSKGVGTKSVLMLLKYLHNYSTVKDIYSGVDMNNIGSIKIMNKCSFTQIDKKSTTLVFHRKIL